MPRLREWKPFLIGFIGVVVGALLVFMTVARAPQTLNWPVTQIVKKVDPSVVIVLNSQQQGQQLKVRGIGSGVVLNRAGDIVTNDHVVAGATRLVV
ncbi:MAG: peptidase A2, partial [Sulfobacillus thermotolerans]|nr:peptidase A2 [Sulfobacillus thermotolerans]